MFRGLINDVYKEMIKSGIQLKIQYSCRFDKIFPYFSFSFATSPKFRFLVILHE